MFTCPNLPLIFHSIKLCFLSFKYSVLFTLGFLTLHFFSINKKPIGKKKNWKNHNVSFKQVWAATFMSDMFDFIHWILNQSVHADENMNTVFIFEAL